MLEISPDDFKGHWEHTLKFVSFRNSEFKKLSLDVSIFDGKATYIVTYRVENMTLIINKHYNNLADACVFFNSISEESRRETK